MKNTSIISMLVFTVIAGGCEQDTEEVYQVAEPVMISHSKDSAEVSREVPAEPEVSYATILSVDENHLAEVQDYLVSSLEEVIRSLEEQSSSSIYIDEYANEDSRMPALENLYAAYQSGFRFGVINGIKKPVVSMFFPEKYRSKIEGEQWLKGRRAGHDYGVFLLKQYLSDRYDYQFKTE
ncbi:MAG: hypothetical protein OQL16_13605 [Gammaproteobacteria bacterium]|nr:hypothetical protein [Gammaproteobacteria bacterium]